MIFARVMIAVFLTTCLVLMGGCQSDAEVASHNISKAAGNFELNRRIVFYNGITGEYMLIIEGLCSQNNFTQSGSVSITCKTGPEEYKRHFLRLSDNVTYLIEQVDSPSTDAYFYRVVFKPSTITPNIDLR
jgi:hypothetical protein